jgi:uncharacterized protein (DUF362 family)
VLDAVRVLLRNGPQGGNLADTKRLDTIVASVDQVAADAFGCELVGERVENVAYLAMGRERSLGTTDWRSLRAVEV